MNLFRVTTVAALGLFAAACTNSVDMVRDMEGASAGTPFTKQLAAEYKKFALFESDEMFDHPDAEYFADKALSAASGSVVEPENLGDWGLPAGAIDEMTTARKRLVVALNASGRLKAPAQAGVAQAKFDCWVEQQEENFQVEDINACKTDFYAFLAATEAALKPKPKPAPAAAAPAPAPKVPGPYTLFFNFDSTELTATSKVIVEAIVTAAGKTTLPITVVGHTDLAGDPAYNDALSLRRAETVKAALVDGGVAAGRITATGSGEANPQIRTADGMKEAQNRRVSVLFR
ncbi:MAG: OmpA family protein [Alphaproteobacteria bacterium]|nr:OmpA family protein [Alphaproteobacteria bacterium]